jgi:hypothetical protein
MLLNDAYLDNYLRPQQDQFLTGPQPVADSASQVVS